MTPSTDDTRLAVLEAAVEEIQTRIRQVVDLVTIQEIAARLLEVEESIHDHRLLTAAVDRFFDTLEQTHEQPSGVMGWETLRAAVRASARKLAPVVQPVPVRREATP